jgi:hypothetical protein
MLKEKQLNNIEGFDGSDIQEGDDVYVKDTDISMVKSDTKDADYTKTQVANSIKVNKNWTIGLKTNLFLKECLTH